MIINIKVIFKIILVDGQMCNVFNNSIKYKLYVFNFFLFKPPSGCVRYTYIHLVSNFKSKFAKPVKVVKYFIA